MAEGNSVGTEDWRWGADAVAGEASAGAVRVERTTVEHAENLLGTDVTSPRLSWVLAADGHGARQTAYQVRVAMDSSALAAGRSDVWDSGRVESDRSVGVVYGGPRLLPRTRYQWRVRVWDQDGRVSAWSPVRWWETATMGTRWQARWIGPATPDHAAPLLRREFSVPQAVSRARLYICGLGYYEAELNAQRVGRQVLDPGFTHYDRTVLYAVHDVTEQVSAGTNTLGVTLGRGFYGMLTENAWNWHSPPWHGEPRLLAQLEIDHPDGTSTVIGSDSAWRVTDGPTRSNSLYAGETYDARMAEAGWTSPGFDDSGWYEPEFVPPPAGTLRAQQHEPIEIVETVRPAAITELSAGVYVVDMGRTMAGWTKLSVRAPSGTVVGLLHGEKLHDDGSVDADNELVSGGRHQLDEYVCAGSGEESWEPKFSYKGFRYVQVTGLPSPPNPDDVLGRVVHTPVSEVGSFRCSEPFFERLDQAMRRTLLNNLHGIPTDTPMYEKNGWTGDAQLGAPTMAYAFGVERLLAKWIGDIADSQHSDGQLPVIVPSSGWGYEELAPSPEWTTVYPYLVREMYRIYGDDRIVTEHWQPLVRYLEWEIARLVDGLAVTALGDYLPPGYDGVPPEDTRLTATAYLYRSLLTSAELGDLVDDPDQASRFRAVAEQCRTALNETFLGPQGHYRTADDPEYRQASNAIPLAFGMVPPSAVSSVVASLVDDIRARGNHLNTGALGTSVLLRVLSDRGRPNIAHAIATQRSYPSWGYWFDNGADTMWEMWKRESRSRDHYFQGTVTQWLYENVAGLRPGDAGYRRFVVRPDARHGVEWARTAIDTVRGRAAVEWSQAGNILRLTVDVPVGSTAEVHVPAAGKEDVVSEPAAEFVRVEPGFVVLRVDQGSWRFSAGAADGSG